MNAVERGQQIHCRSFGNGPRQVLALHCTMAHSGAWRGLADAMQGRITLRATDMLNHGQSPDWNGRGDFRRAMTAAAAAHLDAPADLIGHSFGATVALGLAIAFPEKIRSLTLIESVQFSLARLDRPELADAQTEAAAPFREAVAAGDFDTAARLFNGGWGGAGGWERIPDKTRAAMARGVRIVPACTPAITDTPPWLAGNLHRLSMPVLLLRGAETEAIIGAVNDALERRLPDAVNAAVPGAGHMLPITHPKETAEALDQLFARTG